MALIQVNYVSAALMRTVTFQAVIPADKITFPGMPEKEFRTFKTLYLLHGVFGNYTDWVSGTNIQRWAEKKDLAVIMPSGDNMFYVDQEGAHNHYGEFVGKELVEFTRKLFPLSGRREDTFIAGLSMGGFGALRNGLKYHETFGRIAGLSSALVTDTLSSRTNDTPVFIESRAYAESVFGDLEEAVESDKNPAFQAKKLAREGKTLPQIYLACGTEDSLLPANRAFRDLLKEAGYPVTYEEGKGGHEWDFWNRYIRRVLDWLPLNEAEGGRFPYSLQQYRGLCG